VAVIAVAFELLGRLAPGRVDHNGRGWRLRLYDHPLWRRRNASQQDSRECQNGPRPQIK
jgi:hypothetical protein